MHEFNQDWNRVRDRRPLPPPSFLLENLVEAHHFLHIHLVSELIVFSLLTAPARITNNPAGPGVVRSVLPAPIQRRADHTHIQLPSPLTCRHPRLTPEGPVARPDDHDRLQVSLGRFPQDPAAVPGPRVVHAKGMRRLRGPNARVASGTMQVRNAFTLDQPRHELIVLTSTRADENDIKVPDIFSFRILSCANLGQRFLDNALAVVHRGPKMGKSNGVRLLLICDVKPAHFLQLRNEKLAHRTPVVVSFLHALQHGNTKDTSDCGLCKAARKPKPVGAHDDHREDHW
mmetsp:Transcript_14088/g.35508  ORF Transcript_14088/g.35508 Transcript_14088/m.35508 type:complete len:287 (-) Transcript_14088:33-893(-)